jgi:hypothetical protein
MTSPDQVIAAPPPRRPVPWWVAFALAAVACVAGAVLLPSSWWGVAGVGAVVGLMVTLRPWVPASYRSSWTRSTMIVSVSGACAGVSYAFAVRPFGPQPAVAWPFGIALLVGTFLAVGDGFAFSRRGAMRKYDNYRDAVRRAERYGRR